MRLMESIGESNVRLMESMVAWNSDTDEIDVVPWPDHKGRSDRYDMTLGACLLARHDMTPDQQVMLMFIDYNTIVVGYRVPVEAAHRAFLKIDEYRQRISPDLPGAERAP